MLNQPPTSCRTSTTPSHSPYLAQVADTASDAHIDLRLGMYCVIMCTGLQLTRREGMSVRYGIVDTTN